MMKLTKCVLLSFLPVYAPYPLQSYRIIESGDGNRELQEICRELDDVAACYGAKVYLREEVGMLQGVGLVISGIWNGSKGFHGGESGRD